MVKKNSKKTSKKKASTKKKNNSSHKNKKGKETKPKFVDSEKKLLTKKNLEEFPSLKLKSENDIALDFATKVYKKFDKAVKSVVLFGSTVKKELVPGSDIDIIVILDDVSIQWDQEAIAWYREELEKLTRSNPYIRDIHINTIKLTTWWDDMMRGDPVVINVIRYGETLIDFGGFFEPLKHLLLMGKIRSTPEAIHSLLQRAPQHYARSKVAELSAVDGLYWAMVDSSHAALIAANIMPPSPEHIAMKLNETFGMSGKLKSKYIDWYRGIHELHKKIAHGEITDLKGVVIDDWQSKTEEFIQVMAKLVDDLISA